MVVFTEKARGGCDVTAYARLRVEVARVPQKQQ